MILKKISKLLLYGIMLGLISLVSLIFPKIKAESSAHFNFHLDTDKAYADVPAGEVTGACNCESSSDCCGGDGCDGEE